MKSFVFAVAVVATWYGSIVSAQELSQQDHIRIATQQICPVSGERLGAHGIPLKAKIGEEEVFLCCSQCLEGDVDPTHWATMHKNFAQAQGICPVMEKKLPAKPKWTIVNGRVFYVCCPPCIDKIKADPEMFVKKLDALYLGSLQRNSR